MKCFLQISLCLLFVLALRPGLTQAGPIGDQYRDKVHATTGKTLAEAKKAFADQLGWPLSQEVTPQCQKGTNSYTCNPPPYNSLSFAVKTDLAAFLAVPGMIEDRQEEREKALVAKLSKCGQTLQNSPNFQKTLKKAGINQAFEDALQNRMDLAFGRTAVAYLTLMALGGNEVKVDKDGIPVVAAVKTEDMKLTAGEKQLADTLFDIVEPVDGPGKENLDLNFLLKKLQKFSETRYGNDKSYSFLKMDNSDILIMQRLIPEMKSGAQGLRGEMKNVVAQLKEVMESKGGRQNLALLGDMIRDVKAYTDSKAAAVSKMQIELANALRNFKPQNENERLCIKTLSPYMQVPMGKLEFENVYEKHKELQSCELLAFMYSAFPSKPLETFEDLNGKTLSFIQKNILPSLAPTDELKRGNVNCERRKNADGTYQVSLSLMAPPENFKGWTEGRDGKKLAIPGPDTSACEKINKWIHPLDRKACFEKAKVAPVRIKLTHTKTYKKDETPSATIKLYSPMTAQGGREYQFIDIAEACKLGSIPVVAPVAAPEISPAKPAGDPAPQAVVSQESTTPKKDPTPVQGELFPEFTSTPQAQTTPRAESTPAAQVEVTTATPSEDLSVKECSMELDDNGEIVLKDLLFDSASTSLGGAKIQIGKKVASILASSASGSEPASVKLSSPLKLGKSFPADAKITLTLKDGTKKEYALEEACPNKKDIESDIKTREQEAKDQAKQEVIANACGGGEGKEAKRGDVSFILCKDGVSESERAMIMNHCHGQSGEYDPVTGSIYCAPFNSSGPAALTAPNLPPSIFNGVYGINVRGFY